MPDCIEFANILREHHEYFSKGETLSVRFRMEALIRLKESIRAHERELLDALYLDLRKSEFEAYETEIGIVLDSIGRILSHLPGWARPRRVRTPLVLFGASSRIYREPYGTVLIIGPFNYPFQLVMEPLIGAVAAGNCAVLKPSSNTPHVAAVIRTVIRDAFDERYVRVVEGGRDVMAGLLAQPFDYLFFTGSVPVGKVVMEAAARHLTPVTLELGGKSPCIVHEDAHIPTACERIVWGKFLNAGQTCVAPDYLLVHRSVRARLLDGLKRTITTFYGENPAESPDYGRIVDSRQTARLSAILRADASKIVFGGECLPDERYIAPTILDGVTPADACMQEELFGPVLPVMEYGDLDEAVRFINSRPKPLALYVFTQDRRISRHVIAHVPFGGGCVNDTISHLATPYLPFGGVGDSGMGAYHGRAGFETFSHAKSIVTKTTAFTAQPVYPPFGNRTRLIRRILR